MISTPDGKTWMGLVQGPQENGEWTLRIAVRDEAGGTVREYAYDNRLGAANPARDAILALNDHQLLVLENRGAEGKDAALPGRVWAVDLSGAGDIAGLSHAEALLAAAPAKVPFGDATAALRSFGLLEAEGAAVKAAASPAMGVAPEGIVYDPGYLASGEIFLRQEEPTGESLADFFTSMDLGLPGLGRLARDPAAMPGMGGLVVIVLGAIVLSRMVRRRPVQFRR
jgi:hypothetical protein